MVLAREGSIRRKRFRAFAYPGFGCYKSPSRHFHWIIASIEQARITSCPNQRYMVALRLNANVRWYYMRTRVPELGVCQRPRLMRLSSYMDHNSFSQDVAHVTSTERSFLAQGHHCSVCRVLIMLSGIRSATLGSTVRVSWMAIRRSV